MLGADAMPNKDVKNSTRVVKRLIVAIMAAAIVSALLAAGLVGLEGYLDKKTQIFDDQFIAHFLNYFIICFLVNLFIVFLLIANIVHKTK